ncbi:hypothetical protein [Streptomyces sp. IB2014 016-6]|uniref:zinc finger domain-containing protein n=1 Tax=Streptomyces sp. IB2014 016-6 TaxID=2517818 RepID=UPI0011C93110|nr:hypothetical protein [Streptomyces sp. IB2014 016-6]TXL91622.1 hypothetical protein EW053_04665 [Streptomyces sp. IB2014 016-6]
MARLRFPQLAVSCSWCHAPAGDLCTNPSTRRPRGDDTHHARYLHWVISTSTCPDCAAAPNSPCMTTAPALRTTLPIPHPSRETAAADTYAAQHAHNQQLQIAITPDGAR